MAFFTALFLICSATFIHGQEMEHSVQSAPVTTGAPVKSIVGNYVSIQQGLNTRHIRAHNSTRIKPTLSLLSDFVQQLYSSNNTSNLYKPAASEMAAHDEQQSSSPGPIQHGLSNFLMVLSTLSNRPLSDQSASSSPAGFVNNGIAAIQESFSQVGSSIQNGFNSVFGSNQTNEVSSPAIWNPIRPITSAPISSSQPAFCPANCSMVCGLPQQTASLRIVGGADVTPYNKYPWIALLQYYGQNVGTGTLINDRVVITSGTIIANMIIFNQIKVLFGVLDPTTTVKHPPSKIFSVIRTKLHPQYSASDQFNYNIGLLQLANPVQITVNFMPICMPTTVSTFSDTDAILAGWGARELGGESWRSLQSVAFPLYSFEECNLAYPNSTENNICGGIFGPASKEQHKTSCEGDEGAGLMYPWKNDPSFITLIGITLQIPGVGCGRTNQPAIFTKLHAFIPWVRSQSSGCYCKS